MPLACLPWYDLEETRPWTDALWSRLAAEAAAEGLADVPARLLHEVDHDAILERPDLLLSQTCGVVAAADGHVRILATPVYSAPGCVGPYYASHVVVGPDVPAETLEDLRGARCVVNEPLSHSGTNSLRAMVAPLQRGGRFFGSVGFSGAHVRSLELITWGEADVAAVDCVTYELVRRHRPTLLEGIRILMDTPPAPAPPFVTSASSGDETVARLRAALERTLAAEDLSAARAELLLEGVSAPADYSSMLALRAEAEARGYTEMSFG